MHVHILCRVEVNWEQMTAPYILNLLPGIPYGMLQVCMCFEVSSEVAHVTDTLRSASKAADDEHVSPTWCYTAPTGNLAFSLRSPSTPRREGIQWSTPAFPT